MHRTGRTFTAAFTVLFVYLLSAPTRPTAGEATEQHSAEDETRVAPASTSEQKTERRLLPDGVEHWSIEQAEQDPLPSFFRMLEELAKVIFGKEKPLPFHRTIAFLVGVGNYPHLSPQLPFVTNDLEDLRDFLLKEGGVDEVFIARDGAATSARVKHYMANYFRENLKEDDRLIFYFAGHGTDGGGTTGYIQLYNAKPDDFASDLIQISDVKEWSRLIRARHILFLFDSCSSGLGITPRATYGDTRKQIISTLSQKGSRTVITAGLGDEQTFEVPSPHDKSRGNGIFTRALLTALRRNNDNAYLTINEVYSTLQVQIARFAALNNKKLNPRLWTLDEHEYPGTFLFINRDQETLKEKLEDYRSLLDIQTRHPLSESIGITDLRAESLREQGLIAFQRGNLPQANRLLGRALEIRRRASPDSLYVAESLSDIGHVILHEGALDKAEEMFRESFEIARKLAPRGIQTARASNGVGSVFLQRGDLDRAMMYFSNAHDILRKEHSKNIYFAEILQNIGRVALQRGDLIKAEECFARALEIVESQAPDSRAETRLHHDRSLLHLAKADYDAAIEEGNRALLSFNSEFARAGGSVLERATFRSLYEEFHSQHIQNMAQRGNPRFLEQALETLDHVSARVLLSEITELDETREWPRQTFSLEFLDRDTLIVAYSVGLDGISIFFFTGGERPSHFFSPIPKDQLNNLVENFVHLSSAWRDRPRRQASTSLSHKLYEALITPVQFKITDKTRIAIIPDEALHILPFGALIDPSTGKHLIEIAPYWKTPSLSVLKHLRNMKNRPRSPDETSFLVMANPFNCLMPGAPALRGAAREAQLAARIFDQTKLYIGAHATKENFFREASKSQGIHLALPSSSDSSGPLSSRLYFSSSSCDEQDSGIVRSRKTLEDSTTQEEGTVSSLKILESLTTKADLVVLSGCSSASALLMPDEGPMSLSWAFLATGARSVIASLWKVSDYPTSELMVGFYKRLKEGTNTLDALRNSQLALLLSGESTYDWAAFELYGDPL